MQSGRMPALLRRRRWLGARLPRAGVHNRRMHLGIPGFEPVWLAGLDTVWQAHGERLARLAGRQLTSVDLVYFTEEDLGMPTAQ
jgi:hypothetical protein